MLFSNLPSFRQDTAVLRLMSDTLPPCPTCSGVYTYELEGLFNCPECGHVWSETEVSSVDEFIVRDSVGNILADGDTVVVVKDLKVKGASAPVKIGTKVKGIRLVNADHDIDCTIPGFGKMGLKSEFVKKA